MKNFLDIFSNLIPLLSDFNPMEFIYTRFLAKCEICIFNELPHYFQSSNLTLNFFLHFKPSMETRVHVHPRIGTNNGNSGTLYVGKTCYFAVKKIGSPLLKCLLQDADLNILF